MFVKRLWKPISHYVILNLFQGRQTLKRQEMLKQVQQDI